MARPTSLSTLLLGAFAAGCATPTPPLADPPAALRLAVQPGAATDATPVAVAIEVLALATAPDWPALEPALLAITGAAGAPFRGGAPLAGSARWTVDPAAWDAAGLRQPLGAATAIVGSGVAAEVLPGAGPLPALWLEPTPAGRPAGVQVAWRTGEGAAARRLWVATPLPPQRGTAALFVPAPAPGRAGFAVRLTTTPTTAAALTAAVGDLPTPAGSPDAFARQVELARAAIGEQHRRGALLALAMQLGRPRLVDALLCAGEADLIALGEALDQAPVASGPGADWEFERLLLLALLPRVARGEVTPALRASLLRTLGTAAQQPSALEVLLATATSCPEFEAALLAANREALDDRDAAVRVRAHDWLQAHGAAIAGFEPLGTPAARAAALRAAEAGR